MPDRLPTFVNPEHAATRGFQTSGLLSLEFMEQLHDRLVSPFGEVNVELEFGKRGRRMFLRGNIQGKAILQCQRCLQDMTLNIDSQFHLGLIFNEAEISNLLPGEEPLLIDEESKDELRLANVIEDELELFLPMVGIHLEGQCQTDVKPAEAETNVLKTSKKNPFAVLVDLKKR